MRRRNWEELLEVYRRMMKENPHAFDPMFAALEKWRCLMILWGLEDPTSVRFQSLEEKRHTLLAYKYLGVLWFAKLPAAEHDAFEIRVRGVIPEVATAKKVLAAFRKDNGILEQLCQDVSKPAWVDKDAKSQRVSLRSFPIEAA